MNFLQIILANMEKFDFPNLSLMNSIYTSVDSSSPVDFEYVLADSVQSLGWEISMEET